ncbi:MBL fold metallo-hydrolase [Leptospira levettii]|uniref:MBL fold metallo-hydrolase n=1 Tax=Leptospira levettii TaxID=2023178 RepID=UPI001083E430|nr:MBL fold metallo-hydrolase [Leptospira levettii]MCW7508361.1 MBL fold metallo-hydrolase [Leptospira levettii]MCW7519451.1 MBL fold metallo-hydrolase [Leptospira levettii]TGK98239.1 MBL fold metallo-hydrolase [Leptospira levettii]
MKQIQTVLRFFPFFFLILFYTHCHVSSHTYKNYPIISSNQTFTLPINPKTYIDFQTIKAADWEVPLAGLLDLEDPKSKLANLKDRLEPISIYFYLIKHPKGGTFMIDSGIGESFTKGKEQVPVSSLVASQMNFDKLKIYETTKSYLEKNKIQLKGVFFTHLHLDHVMGASELGRNIPFYVGPGEMDHSQFINAFVQGSTNRLLGENPNLLQLDFGDVNSSTFVFDFFGDQSFFIISVPGHTRGSLAFFIPSKDGGHLVLGDTCHTRFGWLENVIPGTFTTDPKLNRLSLDTLKGIATYQKTKYIYPGHQERIISKESK